MNSQHREHLAGLVMTADDPKVDVYAMRTRCPCCPSTLVDLVPPRTDPDLWTPDGRDRPFGAAVWRCAWCGFALMGLAVPVSAARFPVGPSRVMQDVLSVLEDTGAIYNA